MSVVIETTIGAMTIDLMTKERPIACKNFLKLCKTKYYNFSLFHSVQRNFIAETGDPTGTGQGGSSVYAFVNGPNQKYIQGDKLPRIKHHKAGLVSMTNCGDFFIASQFFITLGNELNSLDQHIVFAEVVDGHNVLLKLNETYVDSNNRPLKDIRITHTVILEDPFDDISGLVIPPLSPEPKGDLLKTDRIGADEEIDETVGLSMKEIEEMKAQREAEAQATILEIVGDLPDKDVAPPENVLFVCKLNPVTTDADLELIFGRFGKIVSCDIIRDKDSGESLQYAFVAFEDQKSCEQAYFKMDNVLIDDRRIHVDFSQSVSHLRWMGKGKVHYDKGTNKRDFGNYSGKGTRKDNYGKEEDNKRVHERRGEGKSSAGNKGGSGGEGSKTVAAAKWDDRKRSYDDHLKKKDGKPNGDKDNGKEGKRSRGDDRREDRGSKAEHKSNKDEGTTVKDDDRAANDEKGDGNCADDGKKGEGNSKDKKNGENGDDGYAKKIDDKAGKLCNKNVPDGKADRGREGDKDKENRDTLEKDGEDSNRHSRKHHELDRHGDKISKESETKHKIIINKNDREANGNSSREKRKSREREPVESQGNHKRTEEGGRKSSNGSADRQREGEGSRRREDESHRRRQDENSRRREDESSRRREDESSRRREDDSSRRKEDESSRRRQDGNRRRSSNGSVSRRREDESNRRRDGSVIRRREDGSVSRRREDDCLGRRREGVSSRRKEDEISRRREDESSRRREEESRRRDGRRSPPRRSLRSEERDELYLGRRKIEELLKHRKLVEEEQLKLRSEEMKLRDERAMQASPVEAYVVEDGGRYGKRRYEEAELSNRRPAIKEWEEMGKIPEGYDRRTVNLAKLAAPKVRCERKDEREIIQPGRELQDIRHIKVIPPYGYEEGRGLEDRRSRMEQRGRMDVDRRRDGDEGRDYRMRLEKEAEAAYRSAVAQKEAKEGKGAEKASSKNGEEMKKAGRKVEEGKKVVKRVEEGKKKTTEVSSSSSEEEEEEDESEEESSSEEDDDEEESSSSSSEEENSSSEESSSSSSSSDFKKKAKYYKKKLLEIKRKNKKRRKKRVKSTDSDEDSSQERKVKKKKIVRDKKKKK